MTEGVSRIAARFAKLKAEGRAAFIPYLSAGDPDLDTSAAILRGLPGAGADMIELGMPFTDPMADGPAVQAAGLRALKAGATMKTTLALVRDFRKTDADTPIVLMGYCNPVAAYGTEAFAKDAKEAGVDGLIIVDLTPEESGAWAPAFTAVGLDLVRLATPTTTDKRLPAVLAGAGGFLYYVSIAGVTGTKDFDPVSVERDVRRLKAATSLPVGVGFGIKTKLHAATIARFADAAVVGSAIAARIGSGLDGDGSAKPGLVEDVLGFVSELAAGVRTARAA
jgi:tryptophan synthase alpha chain